MGDAANRKMLTIKTDGNDVFAVITINIADNGTTSNENILSHKFNKKSYMTDYDPATGNCTEVVTHADFENFIKKLNDIYVLDAAIPHAIKYNNALKQSFGNNNANTQNYSNNNNATADTSTFASMDDFSIPFN
jgi:hypothetical protein